MCRCEDIISCLSALDEVLNEFDDTSLPYAADFETSCGDSLLPISDEIAVSDGVLHRVQHLPSSQSVSHPVNDNGTIVLADSVAHSSSLVNGNKLVDQNQNLDWNSAPPSDQGVRNNNNGPVIHTSHLIQIPVAESATNSTQPGAPTFHQKQNSNSNSNNNNNNIKSTFHSPHSPYSTRVSSAEMNGNGFGSGGKKVKESEKFDVCHQPPKKHGKGGGAANGTAPQQQQQQQQQTSNSSQPPTAAGGTYSKGKSYEILIPKITSGSFSRDSSVSSGKGTITTSSHSSRASIMVPVIESLPDSTTTSQSNSAKVRSQLNVGIFQPANSSQGTRVLVQKEQATQVLPVSSSEMGNTSSHVDKNGGVIYENQEIIGERSPRRELDKDHHRHQAPSNGKFAKVGTNNGGVSSTYITVSEGKSSLGQSSSSGVSSAMAAMLKGDEEQWNFPSEKNLPRSLRKTRKTCFLDEGEAADAKMAKPLRSESPYYCSGSESTGICTFDHCPDQANYGGDAGQGGRNGSCHNKSPRVLPRRGIPSKCEIINKGDGNFALSDSSARQVWNGKQVQQPHTTIVSTNSSSSSPSHVKDMVGRARKKIYEDVVLSHTSAAVTPADQIRGRGISGGAPYHPHQQLHSSGVASSGSPSSTFTSSSGVSLSVTSNPTFGDEILQPHQLAPISKSRKSHHPQQQFGQEQPAPKPRVRQQVPSLGTEIPAPGNHFTSSPQNQFIPLANGRSQLAAHVTTTSSQHSPNSVEIGTDEEHHRGLDQNYRDDEDDSELNVSSGTSPIKTHGQGLRKLSVDTEFEETASDSKILKLEEKSRRGKANSKSAFDTPGQNGSLPNQSQFQMMRMMMMMKSSAKNSSVASSSSRSSSSSGSVSVKSSSSGSEHNCAEGDVFHENIVQDYPTNIFNVGCGGSNGSLGREHANDNERGRGDMEKDAVGGIDLRVANGREAVANNGAVVVLRGKGQNGRGNGNVNTAGSSNPGNTTLDIDDGYLSMINRNEAPLLWPEEFIENETFSTDELKRLSVHLVEDENGEDTEDGSSNSHSPRHPKANKGEMQVSLHKSGFAPSHNNRSSISSSSNTSSNTTDQQRRQGRRDKGNMNNGGVVASTSGAGRSSTEKTDYFSDDSLEMEGEDELLLQSGGSDTTNSKSTGAGGKLVNNTSSSSSSPPDGVVRAATSFVIPFHNSYKEEESDCHSRKTTSHQVRKSNSQVSRIPKIVSSATPNPRRGSSGNITKKESFSGEKSHSGDSSPTSPSVRKPCSFFIPFSSSSDTQANLCGNNEGNRKLSPNDPDTGYIVVNSALTTTAAAAVSLRSSSLPSSRRNSADTRQQPQAAVMWSIGGEDGKPRQGREETKASYDTYVSDVSNKRKVVSAAKQHETNPHVLQGASSSSPASASTSNHNSANPASDKRNKEGEEQSGRVTFAEKLLIVDNDDSIANSANRSQDIKPRLSCPTSNLPTTTSAIVATTTSKDSATNDNNGKRAKSACETEDENIKQGGSFPKRHKFEKQQTFIVCPSRDITTSGGQKVEESADSGDNTPSQQNKEPLLLTTTTDQIIGLERHNNVNHSSDLTPDDKGLNETTSKLDASTSSQTDRRQIEQAELSGKTKAISEPVFNAWEGKSEKREAEEKSTAHETSHVPISKSSAEFKKNMSELNNISSMSSSSSEKSQNKGTTSVKQERAENSQGGNDSVHGVHRPRKAGSVERQLAKAEEKAGGDENITEGHESATEELESVVKMFLKATEGLLDPDEETGTQSGSDSRANLKCTQPLGAASTNSTSDSDHQKGTTGNSAADKISSSGVLSESRDYDSTGESQPGQELLSDSHNMSSFCEVVSGKFRSTHMLQFFVTFFSSRKYSFAEHFI